MADKTEKSIETSRLMQRINEAKSEEEKTEIFKEFGLDPVLIRENLLQELKPLGEDSKLQKKVQQKEIKYHNNIIKILESTKSQNPKVDELKQKEIELLKLLKKERVFLNRFYLFMTSVEEMLSTIEYKAKLQEEIDDLAKELNTEVVR